MSGFRTTRPDTRLDAYHNRFCHWLNTVSVDAELTVPGDELLGRSPFALNSLIIKDSNNEDWVLLKTEKLSQGSESQSF